MFVPYLDANAVQFLCAVKRAVVISHRFAKFGAITLSDVDDPA